ncbi:MAG TPA: GMC family oxidoreductase [Solirubrobacteraceae bacterium]|nr:GMC family oxidoreductase [Solirubrobacteraceae bacterium]
MSPSPTSVAEATGRATPIHADACVIGAGAGGAVLAAELAEGGMDVVVLEQGHRHDPDGFTARPPQMLARLYRDGGQTLTLGNPPIMLPLGSGLGGTTLVNSGTCFRTPPAVLERWGREFGLEVDERSLQPCFERVERALSVAEVTPELAGANAAVARRGAERLGWSHGYLRRNARGCVGSGVCAFGCPTSAKQHTGITYVPRAERAGARIVTGASVERVLVEGNRARGVSARMSGGAGVEVRAPVVIVAAGTIHTPLLLAHSGLGGGSGQLGRNLSLHPATAAFARMEEIVDMAKGVPQSFYVDEFASDGIVFEGVAGPPAYAAMSLPLTGARHAEAMADYRYLAQFGLMVSDSSRGSVHSIAGRTVIRYDLDDADLRRFRIGLARMRELFEVAGAREVYLPLPPGVEPERARARDLKLMAFHPLGTARADARPAHGVIDGDLQLHGVQGVYVADGSAVPSSLGVNPQMTIMALATRLAFTLRKEEIPCPS